MSTPISPEKWKGGIWQSIKTRWNICVSFKVSVWVFNRLNLIQRPHRYEGFFLVLFASLNKKIYLYKIWKFFKEIRILLALNNVITTSEASNLNKNFVWGIFKSLLCCKTHTKLFSICETPNLDIFADTQHDLAKISFVSRCQKCERNVYAEHG